jgi:hypothetical protein
LRLDEAERYIKYEISSNVGLSYNDDDDNNNNNNNNRE